MTDATNTADLYSARWVSKAARIVKTEKSGWCAYLDIVDEDGQYIEAVNICRGISSREVAEALVRNWVRDFAAPAQAEAPALVEAVGEMRASESLGVAPYADIWSWLQPGTKLYSATQVQAMLAAAQAATAKQSPHPEYDKGFSDGWNRCEARQAAAPAQAGEYPELPPLQVRYDGLGRMTTLGYGVSQMRDYADATCAARGAAQAAPSNGALAAPAQPRDDAVFVFWWSDHMPNSTEADAWAEWCALRSNQPTAQAQDALKEIGAIAVNALKTDSRDIADWREDMDRIAAIAAQQGASNG